MANNYSRVYNRSVKQNVFWVERDSIGLAIYDPLESEKNRFSSLTSALTVTLFYHFEKKFEKGIKEGKAFKNRNRISGMRHVRQSSY
jgi:hypothetical protein